MSNFGYERAAILPVYFVVDKILQHRHRPAKPTKRVEMKGFEVGITSLRLRTFATKGTACMNPGCTNNGTYFAVERTRGSNGPYHINLWAVKEGGDVLMTHDHIIARALGGSDTHENTQTMCSHCNNAKSHLELSLISQIRSGETTLEYLRKNHEYFSQRKHTSEQAVSV
jgi:hypothetical protein